MNTENGTGRIAREVNRQMDSQRGTMITRVAAFTSIGMLVLGGIPFVIAYGGTQQSVIHNKEMVEKHSRSIELLNSKVPAIEVTLDSLEKTLSRIDKDSEAVLQALEDIKAGLKRGR